MSISNDIVLKGKTAVAKSYAKINLTLDVLDKRKDGYHNVRMIMQTVGLYDTITVDKIEDGIEITTTVDFIPTDEKNIAYKAAKLFFDENGIDGGVKIHIEKNIPACAGLAGGSGNAAAVLCALNMLYNTNLSDEDLAKLGVKLGADVPYCIYGGTYLAEGIGEVLTKLAPMPEGYVLLVKPEVDISTGKIYNAIDSAEFDRPDTKGMIEAIAKGNFKAVGAKLSNVMETVSIGEYPIIAKIKNKMLDTGSVGALMSGSGSTVFGLYDDFGKAKSAMEEFSKEYKDVYLVSTHN